MSSYKESTNYDMSFKERFTSERKKIKGLGSWKKKAEYIFDYYKFWFAGILIFSVLTYALVDAQIENSKESLIYVAVINSGLVSDGETTLMDGFAEYMDADLKKMKATLDVSYSMSPEMTSEFSLSSSAKISAQFSTKTIDIVVANQEMFDFYCDIDAFHKLDEILPEDFIEAHSDDLIMGKDGEGNEYIFGLDVSGNKKIDTLQYPETPILSVVSNTKNLERSLEFINYLYME